MKKSTTHAKHTKIANDALYYIYRYIDSDINIDTLSKDLGVSRFHLQRLFKEQTGANIYETIKSIRLQKAASLLVTNSGSTITEIASMCGYSSHTSFVRVFKERFGMSPKQWRNGEFRRYAKDNVLHSPSAAASTASFDQLQAKIVRTNDKKLYYIRHRGYNPSIKEIWQKLEAWRLSYGIRYFRYFGLYHDNPIVTPLEQCAYVAAVETKEKIAQTSLPDFVLPGGLHASFEVQGKYGNILRLMQWVHHEWLPKSGYEATTMPSYTIFRKNHFIDEDERFDVTYYLPIRFVI
jgi:AraC family transcriptional regulator